MIKIGYLESRMAMLQVEKKEELANAGSRMNITSLSLLK
jgi:hypothetical protein